MKRFLFLLSFISLIFAGTNAQVFSVGAKLGYSAVLQDNQSYNNLFDVKSNLQNGFNIGAFFRIGNRFFAQPEINYNFLAYKKNITFEGGEVQTVGYKKSTFDIPVLLGISAVNMYNFKFRIMIGPKFSFNAGSTKNKDFPNEAIRPTRLGLDCGIGFDIWRVTLDARYTLLPDLYKYKDNEGYKISHTPENSFVISLGVRIFGDNM